MMTHPIDISAWKEFAFSDIFEIRKGFYNKKPEQLDKGGIPFLGATDSNNGVTGWYTLDEIKTSTKTGAEPNSPLTSKLFPGNAVCVTNDGSVGHAYYQPKQFTCSHSVNPLYRKDGEFNVYTGLFIASVIMHDKYRWQYGRKWRPARMINSKMRLPATASGDPDWQFMEDFIKSLNHKPLSTSNKDGAALALNESSWEDFKVEDIFDLWYGVNLALNACTETSDGINFVSRTESNNGVSARIAPVEGLPPQQAGLITTATGGSVLSTFLQPDPFYSGRDLYVMKPKEKGVGNGTKLFLTTVLEANKFKFNYGRQANKSLPHIKLRLPIKRNPDGTPVIDTKKSFHDDGYIPDWQFMEDYMRSLPYGDRIPEVGD